MDNLRPGALAFKLSAVVDGLGKLADQVAGLGQPGPAARHRRAVRLLDLADQVADVVAELQLGAQLSLDLDPPDCDRCRTLDSCRGQSADVARGAQGDPGARIAGAQSPQDASKGDRARPGPSQGRLRATGCVL